MGCGASLSPSPAHRLLFLAYQDKQSINTGKLRAAIKNISASELDARDDYYGLSALSITALMDVHSNGVIAASVLLSAGADPFSGSEILYETPIGKAMKYNNIKVLEQILLTLDKAGWEKFTCMLAQPEVYKKGSHVPEDTWVLVEGRKGKTSMNYGSSLRGSELPGLSNTVKFEDGSSQALGPEKVIAIPQAPSQALQAIHEIAIQQGCTPEQLERLECLEETDRKFNAPFYNSFLNSGEVVMPLS